MAFSNQNQGYSNPGTEPEFYDAEDQKNINQKKFDRLWEIQQQVRTCRMLISVDPDNKGVFVKMILQNGVVEEKYIDHPERSFARAVMMLHDLCYPELLNDKVAKERIVNILKNKEYVDKEWFYFPKWRNVFRVIILLLDLHYGMDTPVTDEI